MKCKNFSILLQSRVGQTVKESIMLANQIHQCDKNFRPLALLLSKTRLPALVLFLFKNPCLRFLCKLFGWYSIPYLAHRICWSKSWMLVDLGSGCLKTEGATSLEAFHKLVLWKTEKATEKVLCNPINISKLRISLSGKKLLDPKSLFFSLICFCLHYVTYHL